MLIASYWLALMACLGYSCAGIDEAEQWQGTWQQCWVDKT